ncbi:hypothetical protein M0R45_004575 [Rubus argutus]|uniref:F-box domain-containing protein n=1 Tax=Rubus argutus TaxID=59490 RepID=A0AAW1YKI8_RUBAR
MGQSSSIPETSPHLIHREVSTSRRFSFKQLAIMSTADQNDDDAESFETVATGRDYTLDLPDECLGIIFHFLGSGDRKTELARLPAVAPGRRPAPPSSLSECPGWNTSFHSLHIYSIRFGDEARASM